MDETPIQILQKQVKFHKGFLLQLNDKDYIPQDETTKDKIHSVVVNSRKSIIEFNKAIRILKTHGRGK